MVEDLVAGAHARLRWKKEVEERGGREEVEEKNMGCIFRSIWSAKTL